MRVKKEIKQEVKKPVKKDSAKIHGLIAEAQKCLDGE